MDETSLQNHRYSIGPNSRPVNASGASAMLVALLDCSLQQVLVEKSADMPGSSTDVIRARAGIIAAQPDQLRSAGGQEVRSFAAFFLRIGALVTKLKSQQVQSILMTEHHVGPVMSLYAAAIHSPTPTSASVVSHLSPSS